MKSAMCYSGIIILVILIILPPILRITVPDKLFEEEKEEVINVKNLRCSNDEFYIVTSYDNNQIREIVIKKLIQKESENDSTTDTNDTSLETPNPSTPQEPSELEEIYEKIKDKRKEQLIVQDDGEGIIIDFSVTNNSDLDIVKLIQPIDKQQSYYERQKMNCSTLT